MMTLTKRATCRRVSGAILTSLCFLFAAVAAFGQGNITAEEYEQRQQKLLQAIAAMEAEEARQLTADTQRKAAALERAEADALRQRALDEAPKLRADSVSIAKAKAEMVAREKRILKDAPAAVVAQLDVPAGGVPVKGNGPAPGAKPVPIAEREASRKAKGKGKEVEILAQGGSTFNSKANLVVFEKEVVVNHPEFDLICDKLIVFLKKQAKEGESALDKAIATGKKVTVRKAGADGEMQIGQARKVTFDGDTGDVILQDWPQVQSGFRLIQAKAQSTTITLNQDGRMKVNGPSFTRIIQPEKATAAQ